MTFWHQLSIARKSCKVLVFLCWWSCLNIFHCQICRARRMRLSLCIVEGSDLFQGFFFGDVVILYFLMLNIHPKKRRNLWWWIFIRNGLGTMRIGFHSISSYHVPSHNMVKWIILNQNMLYNYLGWHIYITNFFYGCNLLNFYF